MNDLQFERFVADQFASAGVAASPAHSIDQVLIDARRMRPLPRWLAIIKEPPMRISSRVTVGSPMARVVSIAMLTILLAVLTTGALVAGASLSDDGLVTEEVEPGVERIVRDDFGHDLDQKHPTNGYDMDGIAITPDNTVWITSSYSGTDNEANPAGPLVWALGQPGMFSIADGVPATGGHALIAQTDGTLLVIGDTVARFDDGRFVPDDGPKSRGLRNGTLWLVEPDDLLSLVPAGESATSPKAVLAAIQHRFGWLTPSEAGMYAESYGGRYCGIFGDGVTCFDEADNETIYLDGTPINQIAAAPDGSIWAVGGYDGHNGGLYRITLD